MNPAVGDLLRDVGEFVCQQVLSRLATGLEFPGREEHVSSGEAVTGALMIR
jgi:hypothetical protein